MEPSQSGYQTEQRGLKKKKEKRCASDPVLLDTWGPWAAKVWEETGEVLHSLTSDIDRS